MESRGENNEVCLDCIDNRGTGAGWNFEWPAGTRYKVLEALYLHDRADPEALLAFLDFQKAFDLISHTFLIEMLAKFGFGPSFINATITFLNSSTEVLQQLILRATARTCIFCAKIVL